MAARLIIAVLSSPWYGVMAVLAALPLSLVGSVTIVLLSAAMSDESSAKAVVVNLLVGIGLLILSLVVQIAVTVQTARYAGAFSGAKRLTQQPPFLQAFLRGLLVLLLLNVFFFLLTFAISVLAQKLWISWGLPVLNQTATADWIANLFAYMMLGPAAGPEAASAGAFIEVLKLVGVFYTMTLAVLLVPRVCGIGFEASSVWSWRFILARLFIGIPCCSLMTLIVAEGLVIALQFLFGEAISLFAYLISFVLQMSLITGIAFAFEALLLKSATERAEEYKEAIKILEQENPVNYRAMRENWSRR